MQPRGIFCISWMLRTSEGDVTAIDALEIVPFHERRWLIEGQRSVTVQRGIWNRENTGETRDMCAVAIVILIIVTL